MKRIIITYADCIEIAVAVEERNYYVPVKYYRIKNGITQDILDDDTIITKRSERYTKPIRKMDFWEQVWTYRRILKY
jgi:hypothetical protein